MNKGYEKLWLWFGLSLTIPRSMIWQNKMADLLEEWESNRYK